jgi:hypothetical protein
MTLFFYKSRFVRVTMGESPVGDSTGHSATLEGLAVHDQFDVTLEDSDLLGEVELTTNLIIAASESDVRLSTDEIDKILGVEPQPEN